MKKISKAKKAALQKDFTAFVRAEELKSGIHAGVAAIGTVTHGSEADSYKSENQWLRRENDKIEARMAGMRETMEMVVRIWAKAG